jgi:hypothetical protein
MDLPWQSAGCQGRTWKGNEVEVDGAQAEILEISPSNSNDVLLRSLKVLQLHNAQHEA